MANRRVPKFFLNNCAQSSKKTFMCPKFCTNPVLKYTKCHISTNLSNFIKLCLLYCQKLFALAPTNRRFAEKNRLSGNTAAVITGKAYRYYLHLEILFEFVVLCNEALLVHVVHLLGSCQRFETSELLL